MNKPIVAEVLLTTNDIRQWQADLAEAERRVVELRRKLEGAALIFGAKLTLEASAATHNDEGETFGDAVLRVLAGFQRTASNLEVQTALRKTRFREILDKNNGAYYYTVIGRLAKAGKIKKIGKRIRLAQKDEAPPVETQGSAPKATVEG